MDLFEFTLFVENVYKKKGSIIETMPRYQEILSEKYSTSMENGVLSDYLGLEEKAPHFLKLIEGNINSTIYITENNVLSMLYPYSENQILMDRIPAIHNFIKKIEMFKYMISIMEQRDIEKDISLLGDLSELIRSVQMGILDRLDDYFHENPTREEYIYSVRPIGIK